MAVASGGSGPRWGGGGGDGADALRAYLRAVQRAIADQAQALYARGRRAYDEDEDVALSLRITLDADGQVASVVLARSSGSARLDRSVASATTRVRLPEPPAGVPRVSRVVTLPIRFTAR
ncbi:MAG: energy transducer TonB [Sandaracinaceae bacterium]|nr:energy transducer TonB [Sandaracinaceae bacterium]